MSETTPHVEPTRSATGSVAPEYFGQLYAQSSDPWEFETSLYEADKYTATLAALPIPNYAQALELGCSIGVLTRRLAARCTQLLATDISPVALAQARVRCEDLRHVQFECRDLSRDFPPGSFDLIVVSEVGYYFSALDLVTLRGKIAEALAPDGHLLLVHYTGELLFRDLWLRPDLAPRDRSLVTVSALIASGQVAQIPFHLNKAMDNGLTQVQASEVLTHIAFYAGWPNVFSAVPVVKNVFESRRK
jgi:alkylhydroperoxidase/carboxymuconolactone decarboxylase family protein YurZ